MEVMKREERKYSVFYSEIEIISHLIIIMYLDLIIKQVDDFFINFTTVIADHMPVLSRIAPLRDKIQKFY